MSFFYSGWTSSLIRYEEPVFHRHHLADEKTSACWYHLVNTYGNHGFILRTINLPCVYHRVVFLCGATAYYILTEFIDSVINDIGSRVSGAFKPVSDQVNFSERSPFYMEAINIFCFA